MNKKNFEALTNRVVTIIADVAGARAAEDACEIVEVCCAIDGSDVSSLAFAMAQKRADGVPLGLVTGRQRFLGLQLLTRPDVLTAREETELLGNEVIAILRVQEDKKPECQLCLIDMGCGSGNITCAVAVAVPCLKIWASDLTEASAALTRANVAMYALQGRVEVTQGDLFEPLRYKGLESTIDVVVMNPPYIASSSLEKQRSDLLRHEPRAAFDGGPYGISIQTRLIREAPAFLKPGGHLLFEFGQGQSRQVKALVERSKLFTGIRFASDLNGEPRVVILKM